MCTKYASSNFHTQWAQDIHKIFILLKLFPMKYGRKPAEGRETFEKSIEKLIVFKPVSYLMFSCYIVLDGIKCEL